MNKTNLKNLLIPFWILILFISFTITSFSQDSDPFSTTVDFSGFYTNPALYGLDDDIFSFLYFYNNNSNLFYLNILDLIELSIPKDSFQNFDFNIILSKKNFFNPITYGIRFKNILQKVSPFDMDIGFYYRTLNLFHLGFGINNLINNRNYYFLAGIHPFKFLTISGNIDIDENTLLSNSLNNFDINNINYKLMLDLNIANNTYLNLEYNKNGSISILFNTFLYNISTFGKTSNITDLKNSQNSFGFTTKLYLRPELQKSSKIYYIDLNKNKLNASLLMFLKNLTRSKINHVIFLDIGGGIDSFYQVEDLLPLLDKLKQKGDIIISYLRVPNLVTYTLASISDEIITCPIYLFDFTGFAASNLFLKGFFDKYGIKPTVIKSGKYKTASDNYINKEFSDADKEQYSLYFKRIMDYLTTVIYKYRGISKETFLNYINSLGIIPADKAYELNLVDDLVYPYDIDSFVLKYVEKATGGYKLSFDSPKLGAYKQDLWKAKAGIAVVYLKGAILDSFTPSILDSATDVITPDNVIPTINYLMNEKNIKSVLIVIDSPGGSATASDVIFHKIKQLQKVKKVWILQNKYAASGGYYLSLGGQKIISHNTTLTGSIGVLSTYISIQDLLNKYGITYDEIKYNNFATFGSMYKNMSDEEKKLASKINNWFLDKFYGNVSKERGISLSQVKKIAGGRVWSGFDAISINLVDNVSYFTKTLDNLLKSDDLTYDDCIFLFFYPSSISNPIIKYLDGFETSIKILNSLKGILFTNNLLMNSKYNYFYY